MGILLISLSVISVSGDYFCHRFIGFISTDKENGRLRFQEGKYSYNSPFPFPYDVISVEDSLELITLQLLKENNQTKKKTKKINGKY